MSICNQLYTFDFSNDSRICCLNTVIVGNYTSFPLSQLLHRHFGALNFFITVMAPVFLQNKSRNTLGNTLSCKCCLISDKCNMLLLGSFFWLICSCARRFVAQPLPYCLQGSFLKIHFEKCYLKTTNLLSSSARIRPCYDYCSSSKNDGFVCVI